jgi:hypothetical protein
MKLGESFGSKQVEEGEVGEKLESHKGALSNKDHLKFKEQGEEEEQEQQEELEVVLSLICEF